MKRALVLAGGGSKGAYEVGFVKALNELGIDYQIVTGTSIGALNGCLLAQQDYDAMESLWDNLTVSKVFEGGFTPKFNFNLDEMVDQSNLAFSFFKRFLKEKGADITPLKTNIRGLLKEEQLLSSPIDFGLCTVRFPSLKPLLITKAEMEKEHIYDYLISSASCFPVFPIYTFNGQSFIDGGYYDNVPIDLAFDMGAQEIIVVDMQINATHPHYLNRPHVIYTTPYVNLGGFLDFSRKSLDQNKRLGYQTAMKAFGHLYGVKYTFEPFQSPLLKKFYCEILYLERKIRLLSQKDSSGNLVYKFMESHKEQPLKEEDYLFIVLDWFAEMLNRDPSYIYQYDLFITDLLKEFEKYTDSHYQMISLRSTEDMTHTFKNINKKGIIGRILYGMLYPEEDKIDIDKITILFSRELIMARLLFMLYFEKMNPKDSMRVIWQ